MKKQIHFIILLFVIIFLFLSCAEKNPTRPKSKDSAPTAYFVVSPISGNTSTIFNFDASGCSDKESAVALLQVRWDWENDGIWDTGYSTTKTATHQYSSIGSITIKMEVMDSDSITDRYTRYITVTESGNETDIVTDIDGNIYRTVKIGDQWWMAENLKVMHYRNGDAIPNVISSIKWEFLSTGAYCNYDNNEANAAIYGRLYNWYAVNDSRNIAPTGWHVPSDEEWKQLEIYLGMSRLEADNKGFCGTDEGGKLKEAGTSHWIYPNEGATNESGFSALPGGVRNSNTEIGSMYGGMGYDANFWSSTQGNNASSDGAWSRSLYCRGSYVYRDYYLKRIGYSLRLVRDNVNANITPMAFFTVNPASGTIETIFNFDASGCSDNEDMISVLQVHWDWENDGIWDTEYSTTKVATHQYSDQGSFSINMEVIDSGGLTDTFTQQIAVTGSGGETGNVMDIDGNSYKTIKIGNQWWMAENLRVTHYCNGDVIPNVTGNNSEWGNLSIGAYCNYDNNEAIVVTYGRLYNWYAVNDSRNIAPAGWHVASDAEWKQLERYLGMTQSEADSWGYRGTDEGGKLKEAGTTHWCDPNKDASNESGFSALPGGWRNFTTGGDMAMGGIAFFWCSTEYDTELGSGYAWCRSLSCTTSNVYRDHCGKHCGLSIRCLRD